MARKELPAQFRGLDKLVVAKSPGYYGSRALRRTNILFLVLAVLSLIPICLLSTEQMGEISLAFTYVLAPLALIFIFLAYNFRDTLFPTVGGVRTLVSSLICFGVLPCLYATAFSVLIVGSMITLVNAAFGERERETITGTIAQNEILSGRTTYGHLVINPSSLGRELDFRVPQSVLASYPVGADYAVQMRVGAFGYLWKFRWE